MLIVPHLTEVSGLVVNISQCNGVFVILCEYICICIKVPYSVPFRSAGLSIVGLGLVVGLWSVLILFFALSSFRMYVKIGFKNPGFF